LTTQDHGTMLKRLAQQLGALQKKLVLLTEQDAAPVPVPVEAVQLPATDRKSSNGSGECEGEV
jgi:hypothetical protein